MAGAERGTQSYISADRGTHKNDALRALFLVKLHKRPLRDNSHSHIWTDISGVMQLFYSKPSYTRVFG